MKRNLLFYPGLFLLCFVVTHAQEAKSGFDTRAVVSMQGASSSLSTDSPRFGSPATAGYRVVVYPVLKLNENWAITGALQSASRPYFHESLSTKGYGIEDNILQGSLNYSRISDKGSLLVRAGELSTAFGSFLLRYDDAENPLIDLPSEYGYYYKVVSTLGVTGAQVDATRGKWDGRVQFANSSPANPRSVFTSDQYANWAGGGGYTIRQGLRVGVSAYRGPYLNRQYPFFFPGEARPKSLPAHAVGLDAEWGRGHWNTEGEWQTFVMPYTAIPIFREQAGYIETRRTLGPRWYVAGRGGYTHNTASGYAETVEGAAGFRPNRLQMLKIGYELDHSGSATNAFGNTVTIQLVTSLHIFSMARN